MSGTPLRRAKKFKYLGSTLTTDGNCEHDVKARISSGWMKWRSSTGVLCDKRMPNKLKGKLYRTVVRPAMMFGSQCWALKKNGENAMATAEMKMLRWSCGCTKLEKIHNTKIRAKLNVTPIVEKLVQQRLRWYGHVARRDETHVCKKLSKPDTNRCYKMW